jgi:cation-transporting ATPase E
MQEPVGLSESEAVARRGHGEGRGTTAATGRGYLRILRTNLFSFFNNILFVIGITLLLLGRPTDALVSVGVGLLSAVISSVQEVLGKRKLDRLRVIDGEGVAVVRRDPAGGGVERRVPLAEVVRGDLLPLVGGAQIVVDGPLVTGRVEVDESLVTGEAARVLRGPGELLLSGSRCVAGQGIQRADALGAQSYAGRLFAAARTPTVERTPLQQRVDFLIRLIMLVVAVMSGAILARAVLDGQPLLRFVQTAAVLSGLVPYGLFLLITVAYTGGAAVIGRRGVLVAHVGAVEAMSTLDML